MLELNTSFDIISENKETNSLVVRPYSPLFKNPKTDYSCFNITTSLLDPTKDFTFQVISICDEYVKKTLLEESNEYDILIEELNNFLNPAQTTPTPVFPIPINFIV